MNVSTEVLDVLGNAVINGNALKLTGQLDRKLYEATNKVLVAAGGKWNRKAQAHLFENDAEPLMDTIIMTGKVVDRKQELGYFPTPKNVVERLVELADMRTFCRVLEPSAGRGAIVRGILLGHTDRVVAAIDIDPSNIAYMEAHVRELGERFTTHCADFLSMSPIPEVGEPNLFDRVIMNPPFAKQDDIRHVTHALKFLKPGGKLVSVMGASVSFRTNRLTEEFRQLIDEKGGSIEKLPDNSFAESGTSVSTVIVTMNA